MASKNKSSDANYRKRMKEFPCNFNLILSREVGLSRLKATKRKLLFELTSGGDVNIDDEIRQKNFLTWVHFRMDENEEALELNDEVMEITNGRHITALGNRVFIRMHNGDEFEAEDCLKKLEDLKSENDFDELLAEAKAEQAYCHSRLGGHYHLNRAVQLFTEALEVCPQNSLWKFGLGLVYRRMTNFNIFCSSPDRAQMDYFVIMAAKCLFDVADDESANDKARSMAYAQLVSLRQNHPRWKFPQYDNVFHKKNIHWLCEKAVEKGSTMPSVLSACGKRLKAIDVDKAIMYLEKSVEIKKENSIGYHHLGLAYIRKATLQAQGKYYNRSNSGGKVGNTYTSVRGKVKRQLFPVHSDNQHNRPVEDFSQTGQTISDCGPEYESGYFSMNPAVMGQTPNSPVARNVDTASPVLEHQKHQESDKGCPSEAYLAYEYDKITVASEATKYARSISCAGVPGQRQGNDYQGMSLRQTGIQRGRGARCQRYLSDNMSDPKNSLKSYVNSPIKDTPLNKDDELVRSGVNALKESIKISCNENLPAVIGLADVQKRTGQMQEALSNFNKVVNSPIAVSDHRVIVISALEEAGLCYLKLSDQAENCTEKDRYKEKAKEKLTMAVSFAVDLATTLPELKGCENDIWVAFKALSSNLESEDPSPRIAKEKIHLLQLVKAHNELLPAIQKLLELDEDEINNEDTVVTILTTYLTLRQYEDGLAFFNMLRWNATLTGLETWKTGRLFHLRIKFLLSAIYERLSSDAYPQQLFQQLFEMTFGHCAGADNNDSDPPESKVTRDVLLVFDEEEFGDAGKGHSTRVGRHLKNVFIDVFGLEAEENLRGRCSFQDFEKPEMDTQLEEMMKYQVVMIVMDDEERSQEFQRLLETIPYLEKTNPPTIIVYDAGNKNSHDLMPVLRPYRRRSAQDIGSTQVAFAGASGGAAQVAGSAHIKDIFHGGLESVMELFCFIIGQLWPCQ